MPGIVVFGRRWSAGSDDMVVPSLLLVCAHVIWLTTLTVIFAVVDFDVTKKCSDELYDIVLGYIVILSACIIVESIVVCVSMRGGILDTKPRVSMQYLLYLRLVVFLGELSWLVIGIKWIVYHFTNCSPDPARQAILDFPWQNLLPLNIFAARLFMACPVLFIEEDPKTNLGKTTVLLQVNGKRFTESLGFLMNGTRTYNVRGERKVILRRHLTGLSLGGPYWCFYCQLDRCLPQLWSHIAPLVQKGLSVFNSCMILILLISLWCTFDSAGRKWVKMKRFQESMKEKTRRSRRSGSARRNWRQRSRQHQYFYARVERKALRAYEESWDRRLGLMCCCVDRKGRNKNSMSEIAQLFTEFFRDLDVVPSDVIAGLVLLRRYQKIRMQHTIQQGSNDVYRYLSGIPVTPRTQFLQLGQPEVLQQYKLVIHYMKFAMAAYGWPIFMMMNTGTGLCKMVPYLRCCCCSPCCSKGSNSDYVLDDNCCECNLVALKKISGLPDIDLVYVTYHVDIGETPFYVALDNKYKKIVICVRGTLSLQDVLTDLKADAETLPLDPVREDWIGHKGMVQAAIYIKKKLKEDLILARAFEKCKERTSERYDLVLVGHSLGAGTAAILAIMLQQEYQDVHCYAYSPPGGLLSYECMEATKSFITSVVVGKDVVPRIGLPQMELLRTDLINIIKKSKNPKWKIIVKALCCGSESASKMTYEGIKPDVERNVTAHPSDEQIGLTAHKPMFPPGRIILVVRNHPTGKRSCCGSKEPVYQAIWADNSDFQEVLVSPTMVNDHMPDNVMDALEKVLVNVAPPKPTRLLTETERKALLNHDLSPGTPESPSSLKYPITETLDGPLIANNLCSEPVRTEVTICKTSAMPNVNVNVNSLGWDAMTDEILLSLDRQHLFPGIGHFPRLELDLGTDWIHAPLATPEILSAASSMSALSRTNSYPKGDYKSESTCTSAKLETIQQSPDMKLRSDTPSQVSVGDTCDMISETDIGKDLQCSPSCESIQDLLLKPHLIRALNGNLKDMSNGSMNNLLKNRDDASFRDLQCDTSSTVDLGASSNLIAQPCPVNKLSSKQEDPSDGNERLTHTDESHFDDVYERHSPDEESMQYGYCNPNEIYSPAGVGYHPQSFREYHPTLTSSSSSNMKTGSAPSPSNKRLQYSQSESYLKALSDAYKMKRSTEEGDIAHLRDSSKVFVPGEADKSKLKLLQPRDSEPVFDAKVLPKVKSGASKLFSLEERPGVDIAKNSPSLSEICEIQSQEELDVMENSESRNSIKQMGTNNAQGTNFSFGEGDVAFSDEEQNEKLLLLREKVPKVEKNVEEDTDPTLTQTEEETRSLDSPIIDSGISPNNKEVFDGSEPRFFNSYSYHSTSASSFSGESDKHLSSVSGQSDEAELPIIETDV